MFDTLFYSMLIIVALYLFFFRIEKVEFFIIKNFTFIMFSWIWFVLYAQTQLKIDNKDALLMIWWMLAFWYWYKKYERDKELEMIDKLNLKENIDELIIDWKARRVIYEKWYIKDYLWNIIESNYQIKFHEYIWILKDINYKDDFIIMDMRLVISKLMTYEWAKDYFLKQVKLIEKSLEWQATFYRKLNEEKYILKINYYERLKVEVWKNKLSIINASIIT